MKSNSISYLKSLRMKEILSSYDLYKGGYVTNLERTINDLKTTLTEDDYNKLLNSYKQYRDDLINIFSRSNLIWVDLNKKIPSIDIDENIFEDIDI